MKLLCDACGQVVPLTQLRQEAGALVFACQACGASGRIETGPAPAAGFTAPAPAAMRPTEPVTERGRPVLRVIPGAGAAAPAATLEPPATHCPKCLEPRAEEALSCARCGLVFANFRPEIVAPDPELVERWRALHERWSELGEHDRLLRFAVERGWLAELGRLYRIRLALDPKDAVAVEARDRLIARVTTLGLPKASEPVPSDRKVVRVAGYVLLAVLGLALFGLLLKMVGR